MNGPAVAAVAVVAIAGTATVLVLAGFLEAAIVVLIGIIGLVATSAQKDR